MGDRLRLTWFCCSRAALMARGNWRYRSFRMISAYDAHTCRILREELRVPSQPALSIFVMGWTQLWK